MVNQWGTRNISVHDQSVRTNNSVESFHRYLLNMIGRAHPNVWVLLTMVIANEHTKVSQLVRRRHGEEMAPRSRARYRRRNNQIKLAQTTFANDGDIDKFLRALNRPTQALVAQFEPS